jgi:AmiR/NasT family two-component response regulator
VVAIQILRDLRGLRVQVVHPPDNERVRLVEHLRRIGCLVETQWPVPDCWMSSCDVMLLAVEHDVRSDIQRLLKSGDGPRPTLIAIVGYEDPSTLQLVLEAGAVAVIERPIRPFGLLTNLTIARSIWIEQRETEKRIRKLERKLSGIQRIQKAKAILMDGQGLSEAEAYESIRGQAMAKRLSMDDMASAIIHANEVLQYRAKDV